MSEYTPFQDELMHWGIRRFQPYTASNKRKNGATGKYIGKVEKKKDSAELWRKKELHKVSYDYDKKIKAANRYLKKANAKLQQRKSHNKSTVGLSKRIKRATRIKKTNIALKKAELNKVKNYTIKDISSVRKKAIAKRTAQVLASVGPMVIGTTSLNLSKAAVSDGTMVETAIAPPLQISANKFRKQVSKAYGAYNNTTLSGNRKAASFFYEAAKKSRK